MAQAIMDSGSQRTYVTAQLQDKLILPRWGTESLRIRTFRATEARDTSCDVVELGVVTQGDETLRLTALVVSFICVNPRPLNLSAPLGSRMTT